MSTQALYRKWRSQTFDEIVGQEHVTRTLKNALRAGRIRHAYLFTGPRGTGKTSTARILAKAVNCLAPLEERPCNRCHMCCAITEGASLDLIEIDAASNTSVDDVRDLRDKVGFAPTEGRYKVYIIDEVHMLSTSAFNALLKTLEEPPPHVIFILATTEVHKVPATVLSRCQRFDFHRIPPDLIAAHLARVLEAEGVAYEQAALDAIARQATGSLRDALSILDQVLASGSDTVTLSLVRDILGLPDAESVAALVEAMLEQDLGRGLALINTVVEQGTDARQFLNAVLDHLRALLLVVAGSRAHAHVPPEVLPALQQQAARVTPQTLVPVLRAFQSAVADLKLSLHPQLPLELAFVEAVLALSGEPTTGNQPPPAPPARPGKPAARPVPPPPASPPPWAAPPVQPPTGEKPPAETPAPPPPDAEGRVETDAEGHDLLWWQHHWPRFLEWLRTRGGPYRRLAVRLKFGQPHALENDTLTLRFAHSIHRDKVAERESRTMLQKALREFGGAPLLVECVWSPNQQAAQPARTKFEEAAEDPLVRAALKLGGRIVDVRLPQESSAPAPPEEA